MRTHGGLGSFATPQTSEGPIPLSCVIVITFSEADRHTSKNSRNERMEACAWQVQCLVRS